MKFSAVVSVVSAMGMFCLSTNSWAVIRNHSAINMQNDRLAVGSVKLTATHFGEFEGCSGKAVRFVNSKGWDNVNSQNIHMWTNDSTLSKVINITHHTYIGEPLFSVSSYDNGAMWVCVNNSVRVMMATKEAFGSEG